MHAGVCSQIGQSEKRARRNAVLILVEAEMLKKKDLSEAQIEEIRNYYREGHAASEVGEVFGISIHTAKKLCQGCRDWRLNQYSSCGFDNVANIKAKIAERLPDWEYAGNYTGTDGKCDIRCKICGTVKHIQSQAIRHGSARCSVCFERERAEREERKRREKEASRKPKLTDEERKQRQRIVRRNYEERKRRKERLEHTSFTSCQCCGAMFLYDDRTHQKYCSKQCAARLRQKRHETERRIRTKAQMVDSDISLERLYQRDGGICYLCGRVCDWNDREVVDGTIICGDTYPSVDHVIPLSKNGKHAWVNVKLACRKCNNHKRDIILKTVERLA